MKAIYLIKNGPADKAFETRETEIPKPGPGQVLIKSQAFGLNYADVMSRKGMYREAPPLPFISGYENVGHLEALGEGVEGFEVGQRVVAFTRFGSYAEYCLTDQRAIAVIPEDMDNGIAAALATQYCTAYHAAYEQTNMFAGENVLIHAAAGGVGTAITQLAKLKGCTVFGTAGSDAKLDYMRNNGVDHPINYRSSDFVAECQKILGENRMDVVFDSVGGKNYKRSKELMGAASRIVSYGAAGRGENGIFSVLKLVFGFGFMHPVGLIMKSQSAVGVNMLRVADYKPHVIQRCLNSVVQLTNEGKLKPHVGGRFPATEIAKAHTLLESRKSMGKIVVEW